jgi:hypothetical protein
MESQHKLAFYFTKPTRSEAQASKPADAQPHSQETMAEALVLDTVVKGDTLLCNQECEQEVVGLSVCPAPEGVARSPMKHMPEDIEALMQR